MQKPEVGLTLSATLNDGDNNWRKMEVTLTMPCDVDDITDTYAAVKEWCKGNLQELVDEYSAAPLAQVQKYSASNLDEEL